MNDCRTKRVLLTETGQKRARFILRPKGLRFFSELNSQAQEAAVKRERDNPNRFDWDDTQILTEDFREQLAERGFEDTEIYWSLSYCQGDGVAFYGRVSPESLKQKDLEAKKLIEALESAGDEICVEITGKNNHYHHWNSMTAEIEFESEIDDEDLPARLKIARPVLRERFAEYLAEKVKEISRELEKYGYAEIEYAHSADRIREELESGERLYEKDGTLQMSEREFYEWKKANCASDEKKFAETANNRTACG